MNKKRWSCIIVFGTLVFLLTLLIICRIAYFSSDLYTKNSKKINETLSLGFHFPEKFKMGKMEKFSFIIDRKIAEKNFIDHLKVELICEDKNAFSIKPNHSTPDQIIRTDSNTIWSWFVTPKKWGSHKIDWILTSPYEDEGKSGEYIETRSQIVYVDYDFYFWLFYWRFIFSGCMALIITIIFKYLLQNSKFLK